MCLWMDRELRILQLLLVLIRSKINDCASLRLSGVSDCCEEGFGATTKIIPNTIMTAMTASNVLTNPFLFMLPDSNINCCCSLCAICCYQIHVCFFYKHLYLLRWLLATDDLMTILINCKFFLERICPGAFDSIIVLRT